MRFLRPLASACLGVALAGCAALPSKSGHPLLEIGEAAFYLHPERTSQNQADVLISLGMLGSVSRDLDHNGRCTTEPCKEKWQSGMEDVALAYSRLGLHILAVNYYREIFRNVADEFDAHFNLAVELDALGHVDAAQKEFDLAIEKRKAQDAATEEGLARFYLLTNKLDDARSHFEKCVLLGKPQATIQYCAIGLALTRWSGGTDSMLLPLTTASQWPGPILSFVRHQIDEQALAEQIKLEPAPDRRREHLSEALYYVGESCLSRGDRELALRYFRANVRMRVESFWETGAATRRIEQMHGNDDSAPAVSPVSHIPIS